MLPGPIFRREVKAVSRGNGLFAYRFLVGAFIGGVAAAAGLVMFGTGPGPAAGAAVYEAGSLRAYALIVLAATLGVQVTLVALLAAAVVGAGIAEEREKDTLPLLLLTRLTRLELAATKLAGRLVPVFLQLLTGLPFLAIAAWWAGLSAPLVVEILAAMASTIAVAGSLGILASSRKARSAAAQQEAAGWAMFWLVVLPLVARMPARSGTIWGDLLVELRRLASWIAPSSPLSLLFDWSWFSGGSDLAGPLSDRLRTMLAIQAAVFAFGLFGSVVGLRLREPHPTAWDPHRGYRPPVGDDPIYWREYELPWRGSRLPLAIILARQLLIIIRMLLLLSFQTVFLAIAVAIPIGLMIASGYYGYFAFREWWGYDPYPPGIGGSPRDQLNGFLRIVTFMLGLLPMLFAGGVADRILFERNKKTWEPLLTTPLTGPEILRSKMRVSARVTWSAIRWLIPLWLLGIVCGGLHPLGALLAAVGLVAGTWLNLAIGVRLSIRPGATTRSLNYVSVLWVLAMFPIGGLTIIAPVCSARDLDALRSIDPNLPWRAVVVLLAVALAMAALAWSLIRRCFRRFDEWVGRPHRAGGRAAEAGPGPVDPERPSSRCLALHPPSG